MFHTLTTHETVTECGNSIVRLSNNECGLAQSEFLVDEFNS